MFANIFRSHRIGHDILLSFEFALQVTIGLQLLDGVRRRLRRRQAVAAVPLALRVRARSPMVVHCR
jgi:hypothetical protein